MADHKIAAFARKRKKISDEKPPSDPLPDRVTNGSSTPSSSATDSTPTGDTVTPDMPPVVVVPDQVESATVHTPEVTEPKKKGKSRTRDKSPSPSRPSVTETKKRGKSHTRDKSPSPSRYSERVKNKTSLSESIRAQLSQLCDQVESFVKRPEEFKSTQDGVAIPPSLRQSVDAIIAAEVYFEFSQKLASVVNQIQYGTLKAAVSEAKDLKRRLEYCPSDLDFVEKTCGYLVKLDSTRLGTIHEEPKSQFDSTDLYRAPSPYT
jgi:hypothetical protein